MTAGGATPADLSLVYVYHQAESFDTLRAFLDDEELANVMKDADVISEPEATFLICGSGKWY